MARARSLPVLVVCLMLVAAAATQAATPQLAVTEATLDNGLRVLVQDDPRNPIVAVQVFYRVGSRNERPGATGLAHFLEHMMFKGTPTYGRGQIARLIEANGGRDNAYTTKDVTSYYTNIAADKLDLVLRIEADRMRHLLLDAAEIDSERKVVTEERRMRSEDDPDGLVYEEMNSLAFKAHPYRWPIIGWMSDIARINQAELRAFYNAYYQPNNAILVIAGDVRGPAALAMVRRHFAGVRRGPAPPPVTAIEPPAIDERRLVVRREQAQLPIVNVAWHVPNHTSPDAPALELLSTLLSSGRASRLYQKLAYEKRMVLSAGGDYSYFSLDPSLFWFYAAPLPGQTPEAVEEALLAEIERLKQEVVPEEELARARNQIEASFVWQQDSVFSRASVLGRFEMLGSWRLLDGYLPKIRAVTVADVQRVARTYFPLDRKNVSILLPPGAGRPGLPVSVPTSRVRPMAARLAKGTLVLALLLVLGLAYAYGGRLFGSGNGKPAVSVTGTIEAIQVDVSARIAGRIIERPVNEGDRVVAGQLLVRLDETELAAEVRRQEAAVRTAHSALNDLLAGARREEMEDARAALQSASATREWTERDFRRAEGLFRQTLIAAQEVDRARQAYEVAAAQEKSARQKLLLLEAGSRPDQVEVARGQLAQAHNALDMAKTRLREMTILSQLDGVVLRKNLEVGELANPGVPILTLMKPSDIWVRAYVPEEEVARIKVGSPARVAVDGYPARRFPGRISEIGAEAEFTPRNVQTRKERVNLVFRIKIAVDNPEGILKPGMPADADID